MVLLYRIAADATALLHLAFILFVVFGTLLVRREGKEVAASVHS